MRAQIEEAIKIGRLVRKYLLMAVIWRWSEKKRGECTTRISAKAPHVHAGYPHS
jgi:hypothetical protein